MKKILLPLVATATIFAAGITKDDISKIDFVKSNGISVEKISDNGSIIIVRGEVISKGQKQPVDFFVTKDLKNVVFGRGFDINGNELSIPVTMTQYEKDASFIIGKGSKTFYVFTDPECPYCEKFEKMIVDEKLEDKAKFVFMYFPLAFHKNAIDMSIYSLSQKTDKEKFIALGESRKLEFKKLDPTSKEYLDLKAKVDKTIAIGNDLGVRGTPTVFDEKGGKVNWPQLGEILK